MHFYKTIFAAVLTAASVQGAPLEARDPFGPKTIWEYNVSNGAISSTTNGKISKATNNRGQDITTLVTFTYPPEVKGKQCQLAFYLDNTAKLCGSGKIDVFTTNSPAPGSTTGWGPGNQRNNHLGRLSVIKGGDATWDATYSAHLTKKSPCAAPNTTQSFELVGVYDKDYISWDPTVAGPRIIYST
jgi:hypothetical protein